MLKWDDVDKNINQVFSDIHDIDNVEENLIFEVVSTLISRRIELGLTQRQLAEKANLKHSAIARMESFRATPQLNTIAKLLGPLKLEFKLVPEENDA